MKRICLLLLAGLAFAGAGVGIRLNVSNPVGEFSDNVENLGVGFDADFTWNVNPIFGIGLSGGYINYGSERYEESFSGTISRVFVDVTTNNNLAYLNLHLRGGLPLGIIKPYAEGRVGGSYLWTESKIESQNNVGDDDDDNEIASSTNFDDFAFNYGAGGGIMIRLLKDMEGDDGEKSGPLYLDIKVMYLAGGNAEYLTEGSIQDDPDGDGVIYDVSESKTSVLSFQLGVTVEF